MEKRSGTYSRIYLHFIWSTKRRLPIIDAKTKRVVIGVFASKVKELSVELIEANGTCDHIHVLVKSPPAIAPCTIAKELKGASSHFVNHVSSDNGDARNLYWQDGYGVISVSPSAVNSVREYIRCQAEHHEDNSLNDDLENIGMH